MINYYEKINNAINNKDEKSLDKLYSVKPVRLKWIIAKAQILLSEPRKNIKKISEILRAKGCQLYSYSDISEYFQLYSRINLIFGHQLEAERNKINSLYVATNKDKKLIDSHYEKLNYYLDELLNNITNANDNEVLIKILEEYFVLGNKVMYILVEQLVKKLKLPFNYKNWISKDANMGYLLEDIQLHDKETFILVIDGNVKDYEVAAYIINKFNKQVFIINKPIEVEIKGNVNMQDTVHISIENSEEYYEGIKLINPIRLVKDGEVIGDNIDYIIEYICKNYTEDDLATVITSGKLIDELSLRPLMKKRLERLSQFEADYREDNMVFGWCGNYLSYISKIYCFNVEEEINKPSECKFSIVIPARNSAYTLRYTLETCLNQRYKGDYEIVVSDNSTNGNTQVYDLVKEINDPRIKYYKAPRNLHLPKSFEFAYLKAKGDFIISIGSDDALLPWGLNVIDELIDKYPNEDIIHWERGFYAWPGFNGGQENKFFIPREYKKDEYKIHKVDSEEYLAKILNNPEAMYGLPMLYINSGFKRSYIKKIYQQTGRLWDGVCQDIYMGVINVGINKEILNIQYPITIAGMSNSSIGYLANKAEENVSKAKKNIEEVEKTNNIGGFSMSSIERLMPQLGTDVSSLYNSLLRSVARGVFPDVYLTELFDFKKMFLECYKLLDVRDVYYDKKIHYMRYTASLHGEEFLKWFDEAIYKKALIPRIIDEEKVNNASKKKTYSEGKTELGGMILDASKHGVSNIFEAVKLFEKLTNL